MFEWIRRILLSGIKVKFKKLYFKTDLNPKNEYQN